MKNQKVILGIIAIGLVVLVGGYFIFSPKKSSSIPQTPEPKVAEEETILTLSAEEIGLELTTINDNTKVVFKIEKPQGIETIEYELTWGAKVKDIPSGDLLDVMHGDQSSGPIEINGKPYKAEIIMGSCSDVCHYDEDVSGIRLILKVTKKDSKVYSVEKAL